MCLSFYFYATLILQTETNSVTIALPPIPPPLPRAAHRHTHTCAHTRTCTHTYARARALAQRGIIWTYVFDSCIDLKRASRRRDDGYYTRDSEAMRVMFSKTVCWLFGPVSVQYPRLCVVWCGVAMYVWVKLQASLSGPRRKKSGNRSLEFVCVCGGSCARMGVCAWACACTCVVCLDISVWVYVCVCLCL